MFSVKPRLYIGLRQSPTERCTFLELSQQAEARASGFPRLRTKTTHVFGLQVALVLPRGVFVFMLNELLWHAGKGK